MGAQYTYEGMRVSDSSGGLQVTCPIHVTGLPENSTGPQLLMAAYEATPKPGDKCEFWPGLFVSDVNLEPWGQNEASGSITFSPARFTSNGRQSSVRGGTTASLIRTELHDGKPIQTKYTPPGGTDTLIQGGSMEIYRGYPTENLTWFQKEKPSAEFIDALQDHVNSSGYHGRDKGVWLCNSIIYEPIDDKTWQVSATLLADPYDKWQKIIRRIDPQTGQPQWFIFPDVAFKNRNGFTVIDDPYPEADFAIFDDLMYA